MFFFISFFLLGVDGDYDVFYGQIISSFEARAVPIEDPDSPRSPLVYI